MKAAKTVALRHLRITLKSPGALVMMFGLPLVLIFIFGAMGGGQAADGTAYPVALMDDDGSLASRKFAAALTEAPSLLVWPGTDADLPQLFADKKIIAAIRIPLGFEAAIAAGHPPDLTVMTAPEGNAHIAVRPTVTRQAMILSSDYRLAMRLSETAGTSLEAAYDHIAAERAAMGASLNVTEGRALPSGQKTGQVHVPSLGFVVMFVMMMIFFQTGVILQERRDGTWNRLLMTPASRASILGGYLLSFFLTGAVQFAGLVILTSLIFDVYWGPVLPLTVMAGSFILCATGLGLLVASLVKTQEQQGVAGTIAIVATSMLGGVYWPLDVVSETMRRIGYFTPQAWAMDGFREVMLRGGAFDALLLPVGVLAGVAALSLTFGVMRIRYQ